MGADVTVRQEIKIAGKWHHYDQARVSRNYELFEKMAGVRGSVEEALVPPRGPVPNPTYITKIHRERIGEDGHTDSWFGLEEIVRLRDWMDDKYKMFRFHEEFGYLLGNDWDSWKRYPEENSYGIEDVRWIFWFDS